jgi:hypothetical protein
VSESGPLCVVLCKVGSVRPNLLCIFSNGLNP